MSNQVIIWTNDDGELCETINGDRKTLAEVQASITKPSFITTRDQLPQDNLFRAAWVENGSTVYEDLTKAKVISCLILKEAAERALDRESTNSALGDPTVFTVATISAAYQECKTDLETSTTTASLRHCLKGFVASYAAEVADNYGLDLSNYVP